MTEPAARRRLREAREEATAKRLAAEATDCTMACVMGHTNEPGCLYDTTTSETIPADLMRAAELAAYEALKEDHREPPALWHALIRYAVAAVLPLHEQQVRAAIAAELEAHAESIGWYEDGSVWAEALDVIRQAPWVRAARGGLDA